MNALYRLEPFVTYIKLRFIPIINLLSQSFLDFRYATLMPSSTQALKDWDGKSFPTEEIAKAMVIDLIKAKKNRANLAQINIKVCGLPIFWCQFKIFIIKT